MDGSQYDIAIIGGGVNGCGIARDASGRGLKVYLCEQGDLASGTSSRSTKLVHGGLRYLERYEFRLVREALKEREVLLAMAPHIIWPLRFVLPYHSGLRNRWLLRLGLLLYDRLGGRKHLPATRTVDLRRDEAGSALKPRFTTGFEYSDCWVDDARLVVLNAMDAAEHGATIETRHRLVAARRQESGWRLDIQNLRDGSSKTIRAKALVNAAGPWVSRVAGTALRSNAEVPARLVKGSHIVVPKLFDHDRAYIFQNADGRIVFAIPYEAEFTLVGTTDEDFDGNPENAKATSSEIDYLCDAVSEYFRISIYPHDVVWTYSGVRSLYDEGATSAQDASRDYTLTLDEDIGAPLLSIYGGKITTYRRLSEEAMSKLSPFFPSMRGPWTAGSVLPGGDFANGDIQGLIADLRQAHPFLSERHAARLCRTYGTRSRDILHGSKSSADLGRSFGGTLTEAELRYLCTGEWAETAEDVVWRRSKLGLKLTADEIGDIEAFMASAPQAVN